MRRLVVIGANGQLGFSLSRLLAKDLRTASATETDLIATLLTRQDLDIGDHELTRSVLMRVSPDIVVNTAAYHHVDDCEVHPVTAFEVNALAVQHLAKVCRDLDADFVHLSTDYVFGGGILSSDPYSEDDPTHPVNAYGVSKVAGEHFVQSIWPKHYIVRTSGLFGVAGSPGKGGNFVERMIKLAEAGNPIRVVNDQRFAPTFAMDLARRIIELVHTGGYGLYHITNSGSCTWYEFAQEVFTLSRHRPELRAVSSEEFGARARRPRFSVLNLNKFSRVGHAEVRSWKEALRDYMAERVSSDNAPVELTA